MYVLTGQVAINWVPDGAGAMSVPDAQKLTVFVNYIPTLAGINAAPITVPGANAPSTANLNTAAVAFGAAVSTMLQANVTQIQGFATGGD